VGKLRIAQRVGPELSANVDGGRAYLTGVRDVQDGKQDNVSTTGKYNDDVVL
jgi:hypothetical protein